VFVRVCLSSALQGQNRPAQGTCIRAKTPLSLADAQKIVADFVRYYNDERLHSAIGYVTPKDQLAGRAAMIHAARDAKLAAAREVRKAQRQAS
jgi:transposase InsO family protein